MSLFKAQNFKGSFISDADRVQRFLEVIDSLFVKNEAVVSRKDVVAILDYYVEASVNYLAQASGLVMDHFLNDEMKLMNSYLAEAMSAADLHYFHQEGKTIIDLTLQATLDKQDWLTPDEIDGYIAEIEGSYMEEVEEDEE